MAVTRRLIVVSRLILHLFSTFCPSIWLNDGIDCGQHLCFSCATAPLSRCIFQPQFLFIWFCIFRLVVVGFCLIVSFFCFCRFAMYFVVALTIKLSNVFLYFGACFSILFLFHFCVCYCPVCTKDICVCLV